MQPRLRLGAPARTNTTTDGGVLAAAALIALVSAYQQVKAAASGSRSRADALPCVRPTGSINRAASFNPNLVSVLFSLPAPRPAVAPLSPHRFPEAPGGDDAAAAGVTETAT